MALTISVRLEKEILKELAELEKKWQTDRSEAIRRLLLRALQEWKVENALEELRKGRLSIGKAARDSGISLAEMLDLVKKKKIDWVGYSDEDLQRDFEILK